MLLAIDVGNTETKLGLFDNGHKELVAPLARDDRIAPHRRRVRRLYHAALCNRRREGEPNRCGRDRKRGSATGSHAGRSRAEVLRRDAARDARRSTASHHDQDRSSGRGRRRFDCVRDRRCGAPRRPVDLGELRHGDGLYGNFGKGRIPWCRRLRRVSTSRSTRSSGARRSCRRSRSMHPPTQSAVTRSKRCKPESSLVSSVRPRHSLHGCVPSLASDAPVVATGGLAQVIASNAPIIGAVDPHLSLYGLRAFATAE